MSDKPRASISAIFRIVPGTSHSPISSEAKTFFDEQIKKNPHFLTGKLQLLFIKRSINPKDFHSGQIAFPGGKKEENEISLQTAKRETFEEIGIDLNTFMYLGRNDEKDVYKRFINKELFVCTHGNKNLVFLQNDSEAISLNLNPNEVAEVAWVDFDEFLFNFKSI